MNINPITLKAMQKTPAKELGIPIISEDEFISRFGK